MPVEESLRTAVAPRARAWRRPRNEKVFAVIPIGYPAPDTQVSGLVRTPLDRVRVWADRLTYG
jgi:hypothetical protein